MKQSAVLILLLLLAGLVAAGAPFVGRETIEPSAVWQATDETASMIFWQLRVPRVLLALMAGAGLAISGMAFQAVFRNPLAEPFTLGIASGAALGASLYIHLGLAFSLFWISGVSWFAFAGSGLAVLLVFGLTRVRQGFSSATLLLAGVAINFFFSSVILFLQYRSDFTQTYRMLRWVMGGLDRVVGFDDLLTVLPFVATGVTIVFYLTHELNLLTTGEELAASRGVEVVRTKVLLFFAVSLVVSAVLTVLAAICTVLLVYRSRQATLRLVDRRLEQILAELRQPQQDA